jgi:hypothetical protein
MVTERKSVSEVIELVRDGRAQLEAALAKVPEDDATKLMLAHVLHWEQVMVARLGGVGPPIGRIPGGTDAINAAVAAYHSARPFADVKREFETVHRDLLRRVEALSDDEVNRPMGSEPVWQNVAGETWGHYPEHVAQLETRASTAGNG